MIEGERERGLRHDRARGVGDRDVQLPRAVVDARDETQPAGERHERRAAAAARGERRVQQARGRQLFDDVRDRGGREPGAAGELDLREAAVALQRLDDARAIGLAQRGLRARRGITACHRSHCSPPPRSWIGRGDSPDRPRVRGCSGRSRGVARTSIGTPCTPSSRRSAPHCRRTPSPPMPRRSSG